jgi:hypothetical protein
LLNYRVTDSTTPLRVGLIGYGLIGYGLAGAVFHAPLIAATPELRGATVASPSGRPGSRGPVLRSVAGRATRRGSR